MKRRSFLGLLSVSPFVHWSQAKPANKDHVPLFDEEGNEYARLKLFPHQKKLIKYLDTEGTCAVKHNYTSDLKTQVHMIDCIYINQMLFVGHGYVCLYREGDMIRFYGYFDSKSVDNQTLHP